MSDFDEGRDDDRRDVEGDDLGRRPRGDVPSSGAPLERAEAGELPQEEIAPEEQGPGFNPSYILATIAIVALVGFGLFYAVLVAHSHHAAVVAVVSPTPVPADQQGGSTVFSLPTAQPTATPQPTPTPAGARPSSVPTGSTTVAAPTSETSTVPPLQTNAPQPAQPRQQPAGDANMGSSRMQLDQPPSANSQASPRPGGAPGNPQDQAALAELGTAPHIIYTPVRNGQGQISAVVPRLVGGSRSPVGTASFVTPDEAASLAGSTASRNLGTNGGKVGYVRTPSDFILQPTTVIPIRLVSRVVSDIPGTVTAIVTSDIYDSVTHSQILIPHGTTAEGVYDSGLIAGQSRLIMAWPLLVFPPYAPWNAREYALGGQPGADALGTAGLAGKTDFHRGEVFRSAAFLTVLGAAEALLTPNTSSTTFSNGQSSITQQTSSAAGAQLANIGNKVIDQQIQRAPTITLDPPYETQIRITRDLPLAAFEVDPTGR